MAREGFSELLTFILTKTGHGMLSVADVSCVTGYSEKEVVGRFYGWTQEGRGKKLPAVELARQLSR